MWSQSLPQRTIQKNDTLQSIDSIIWKLSRNESKLHFPKFQSRFHLLRFSAAERGQVKCSVVNTAWLILGDWNRRFYGWSAEQMWADSKCLFPDIASFCQMINIGNLTSLCNLHDSRHPETSSEKRLEISKFCKLAKWERLTLKHRSLQKMVVCVVNMQFAIVSNPAERTSGVIWTWLKIRDIGKNVRWSPKITQRTTSQMLHWQLKMYKTGWPPPQIKKRNLSNPNKEIQTDFLQTVLVTGTTAQRP